MRGLASWRGRGAQPPANWPILGLQVYWNCITCIANCTEAEDANAASTGLERDLLAARGDVAGLERDLLATLSDNGARLYDELGVAQRRLAALEEERRAALYEDPRLLAAGQRIRGLEDEANRLRQPRAALEEELADAHAHSSLMHRNLEHIQEDNAHYGARLLEQRDELIQLRRQLDAEQQLRLEQAAQIGSEARTLPSERTEASLRAESAEWRETAANASTRSSTRLARYRSGRFFL